MDEIDSLITLKYGAIPQGRDGIKMLSYLAALPEGFLCNYGYRRIDGAPSFTRKSLFAKADEVKADLHHYIAQQHV